MLVASSNDPLVIAGEMNVMRPSSIAVGLPKNLAVSRVVNADAAATCVSRQSLAVSRQRQPGDRRPGSRPSLKQVVSVNGIDQQPAIRHGDCDAILFSCDRNGDRR